MTAIQVTHPVNRLSCEPIESTETDASDETQSDMDDLVFNPSNGQGSVGQAQDGSQVWLFEAMDGGSILRIELYAGYGAPTAPGVVNLTEAGNRLCDLWNLYYVENGLCRPW